MLFVKTLRICVLECVRKKNQNEEQFGCLASFQFSNLTTLCNVIASFSSCKKTQ